MRDFESRYVLVPYWPSVCRSVDFVEENDGLVRKVSPAGTSESF